MKNKHKAETKILIALAFFSIGIGLWGNFRQLWLQDNNFLVEQISNVLSIGTFLSAVSLFMCATKLKLNNIQTFIGRTLFLKIIVMCSLYLLKLFHHTDIKLLVDILIILDVVLEKIIVSSIYPFILTIEVSDKLYSKRKLVEYLFMDVGILLGGIFIGKKILHLTINYNICLFFAIIFLYISYWVFVTVKVKVGKVNSSISFKYLFKDKINRLSLMFMLTSHIAMATGLGLKMLMLTNGLKFSDGGATTYLLVIGLVADFLGIIALKYLTPKNDYITVSIKFGIRFLFYLLAFLSNNLLVVFIAITWSILISTAYENIIDAPYINRIDKKYQLFFADIRYLISMLGEAIGLFFAGITYKYGLPVMLGLSAFFMIFQMGVSYLLIYFRKKETIK